MAVRMNPYLTMDGNAREAVEFYAQALGAQVLMLQTFAEMPRDPSHPLPPGSENRIVHARLRVGETELMVSDTFPGTAHKSGSQVTIALVSDDAETIRRCFEALAVGGRVTMPLQKTFFSPAYGQVTDRFGVPWQLNTETLG